MEIQNTFKAFNLDLFANYIAKLGEKHAIICTLAFNELKINVYNLISKGLEYKNKQCRMKNVIYSLEFFHILNQKKCLINDEIVLEIVIFFLNISLYVSSKQFPIICSVLLNILSMHIKLDNDSSKFEAWSNLQCYHNQISEFLKNLYNLIIKQDESKIRPFECISMNVLNDKIICLKQTTCMINKYFDQVTI